MTTGEDSDTDYLSLISSPLQDIQLKGDSSPLCYVQAHFVKFHDVITVDRP